MNQLAWMTVKFRLSTASSTCSFASARGKDIPGVLRKDTKRKRLTFAFLAAFTRVSCPSASTDCIESPGCLDKVDDAVEITASTPRQAAAIDSASLRSPVHSSAPDARKLSTLSL